MSATQSLHGSPANFPTSKESALPRCFDHSLEKPLTFGEKSGLPSTDARVAAPEPTTATTQQDQLSSPPHTRRPTTPVAVKPPAQLSPPSCEDTRPPQLSTVNLTSASISPDPRLHTHSDFNESSHNRQSALESSSEPPTLLLENFVSPLFLEPFQDPSAVPTHYTPKYTSSLFHEAFRDQWLEGYSRKRYDLDLPSLPSLFNLEMMAGQSPDNPTASQKDMPAIPADPEWVKSQLHEYGLHQGDHEAWNRNPQLKQAVNNVLNGHRDSAPSPEEIALYNAKLNTYRSLNEDTFMNFNWGFIGKVALLRADRTVSGFRR
ncbi:MAG: hypothetical protein Q9218_006994 [Villophora microphyllina]